MLRKILPALLLTLALAACTTFHLPNVARLTSTQPVRGDLILTTSTSGTVVLRVTNTNPEILRYLKQMLERNTYADMFFYDQTGTSISTGNARLSNRPSVAGPYVAGARSMPPAAQGEVGLLTHPDGSVGPEFLLVYGPASATFANVRLGTIVSGENVLATLQKGDKLTRMFLYTPPPPPAKGSRT